MKHLKVNLAGMFYGLDVSLQNECFWGFLLMKSYFFFIFIHLSAFNSDIQDYLVFQTFDLERT
jgi:hypothetical protein